MSSIPTNAERIQSLTASTSSPSLSSAITDEPGTPSVAAPQENEGSSDAGTPASNFSSVFEEIIARSSSANLNEEELYAASIAERLEVTKDSTAAQTYHSALESQRLNFTRASDGYVSEESAAQAALESLVGAGVLTQQEGDAIHTESFAMAQLDDNTGALFDGRGSDSDASIATASRAAALAAVTTAKNGIDTGALTATLTTRPLTTPDALLQASSADGAASSLHTTAAAQQVNSENLSTEGTNSFVFKPQADHTGNLVILTPAAFNGAIENVSLRGPGGNLLETGRYTGVANGNRGHFRFDRAGGDYNDNLTVEIAMSDGSLESILIENPGSRYEE